MEECHIDSVPLYRLKNKLLNRKHDSSLPDHVSSHELVREFSLYYRKKVDNLCSELSTARSRSNCPHVPTLDTQSNEVFDSLRPVTDDEVMSIIFKSSAKTCDLDPLPTFLLKKCFSVVFPAITSMINSSFTSGTVPLSLKAANVRPILKKQGLDKNDIENYLPISTLPFISMQGTGKGSFFSPHGLSS